MEVSTLNGKLINSLNLIVVNRMCWKKIAQKRPTLFGKNMPIVTFDNIGIFLNDNESIYNIQVKEFSITKDISR